MEIDSTENFPQINCQKHKKPIILVCPYYLCNNNIFLCANCVHSELEHINRHDPFILFEDFISNLKTSPSLQLLKYEKSIEDEKLLSEKKNNLVNYVHKISNQNQEISLISDKLREIYNDKCGELIDEIQKVANDQANTFSEVYENYEIEIETDNRIEANLYNIEEISNKIKSFQGNMENSLKFLGEVFNNHKMWEKTSDNFRFFGKNRKQFFR